MCIVQFAFFYETKLVVLSFIKTLYFDHEYLFTAGGKKIKCQPRVTKGHEWLEMAPRERQKPLNCLHQPMEVNNELFLISSFSLL